LPTLAELAGGEVPGGVDGISIVPGLLGDEEVGNDRPLYWEFQKNPESELKQAVRWGGWKAVRLSPQTPLEIYDLRTDVGETQNLAEQHPDLVEKFESYLLTVRN
ncbi:MAG: sulfatase, partial [Gammaproteobacteria bacterium]|nr:sulfatase [Gammaproteobacteria bacterium]